MICPFFFLHTQKSYAIAQNCHFYLCPVHVVVIRSVVIFIQCDQQHIHSWLGNSRDAQDADTFNDSIHTRIPNALREDLFFSSSQVYFRRLRVAKWNNYSGRKMSKSRTKVTCNFTRMTPFIFFLHYSCSEFHFGFRTYKRALMNEGKQQQKKNARKQLAASEVLWRIYNLFTDIDDSVLLLLSLFFCNYFFFFLLYTYVDWVFWVSI